MYIKFYIEEGFLRGGERVELQLYYFITGYIDTVMEMLVWSTRHSTKRLQHTLGITSQAIRFIDELFEFGKDVVAWASVAVPCVNLHALPNRQQPKMR